VNELNNNEWNKQRILAQTLLRIYETVIEWTEQKIKQFPMGYNQESRDNLIAYLFLKEILSDDFVRTIEDEGLSSIYRYESHLLSRIELILRRLQASSFRETKVKKITRQQAEQLLAKRALVALGESGSSRRTRIMVTLEERIVHEPETIEQLLLQGMDIARINCAHDSPEVWKKMIESVHKAEASLQEKQQFDKRCKIYMDLPGPKIRINKIEYEQSSLKLTVRKDEYGNIIQRVVGLLCLHKQPDIAYKQNDISFILETTTKDEVTFVSGDELTFRDMRGRRRTLKVIDVISPTCVKVELQKTAYIQERAILKNERFHLFVQSVMPIPVKVSVKKGAHIRIYLDETSLEVLKTDLAVKITTTLPKAFRNVRVGHRLYIDDGKIFALIQKVTNEYVEAEVISTGKKPRAIKEGAGINLPDSFIHLNVSSLTEQDLELIPFIIKHADIIGLSFVHAPHDVAKLHAILAEHGAQHITVIAKIETGTALHNLARILLEGLKLPSFGVMIARGDLAIEVGFENMSIVQHEILALCQAAHVPVIWATQVLENLAKKGLPARAEISDVSLGQRAQCVMLNKGPYIVEAVEMLAQLLEKEEAQPQKRRQTLAHYMTQYGVIE
jgi:pyruvate kinase